MNNPAAVQGKRRFLIRFRIRKSKKKGINTCAISTTLKIPVIEINAKDRNAGCLANIKTPSPASVVIAERTMDDL